MENANVRYLVGDVFDRMAELPDASVDLILTSPPFLALRSYLPADHPDKDKEIGSEKTPSDFIDVLLRLTAEWRRLLAPHGSICVELGDTFSGARGYGTEGSNPMYGERADERWRDARVARSFKTDDDGWPLAKSLTLVPEAYRFALAYGVNPHTGAISPAGQWRIRNVIRWVRPNPPVGALGDKFRPATSELVVACVLKDRYFDLDAVREPHQKMNYDGRMYTDPDSRNDGGEGVDRYTGNHAAGAPPLDWWKISPKGYAGAHYAVWPSELCIKPIKAMCPKEVCRECGQPRRRIAEQPDMEAPAELLSEDEWREIRQKTHALRVARDAERLGLGATGSRHTMLRAPAVDEWSDCGHDNYRPGLVLDPFAGTGTTLAVAHGHGRDAIGIDIDERSAELARERVGPLFLEVVGSV